MDQCTRIDFILSIIVSIICSVLVLSVTHGIIKLSVSDITTKGGKCFAYSFFIVTQLAIICVAIASPITCYGLSYSFHEQVTAAMVLFYGLQALLLLVILFDKIKQIFVTTSDALSNCTKNTYHISFMAFPLCVLMEVLLYKTINSVFWNILIGLSTVFFVTLMLSLLTLFIYKLVSVYKSTLNHARCNDTVPTDTIEYSITKTTMLTATSIVVTLASVCTNIITNHRWITTAVVLTDLYTNYLCIIMCYNSFHSYYKCLCSCMNERCRRCCVAVININKENVLTMIHNGKKNTTDIDANASCNKTQATAHVQLESGESCQNL
eukprot:768997_1